MWKKVQYQLKSACPMILHNARTADPMDKFTKLLKQISSKRKKTDADLIEMAHLEFLAGLYMSEEGPCIPATNIEATLIAASKKSREGQLAKAGMYVDQYSVLEYEGPREAEELWKDERFHFYRLVRVQSSRVMRMRPVFNEWSTKITVNYEESVVNKARVDEWVHVAGLQVGFCDWRPRYGRFSVV